MSASQGRSPAPILLVAHLVAAVGGLGTFLALVVLGLWGASGAEPATVYPAMYVIESRLLRPLAVLALVTGVAIALTSGWGLLRHRWVTVKLGVTALAAIAVIFVLTPSLGQAAEAALAQDPGQVVGEGRRLGYAVVPATRCTHPLRECRARGEQARPANLEAAFAASWLGESGLLFLLGVALHPARDGHSIATVGEVYGVTHALLAYGLLLQATSLVSLGLLGGRRLGASGGASILTASAGTLLWFGLIVMDGTRNPVTAQHSPDLVHTPADLELGVAMIVLPALVCFPLGYMLFARMLAQSAARLPALLVGVGCVVYWVGGLAIFAVGPHSPVIQVLEVAGALPYGLGVALGIRTLTEDQRVPDD